MATTMTRQHSTTRPSTRRPESPIKRGNSARHSASFRDSARSPSPFSLNTSHNAMPTPVSNVDSGVLLKPASPVRRRSARLSKEVTKVSVNGANGTLGTVASTPTTLMTASLPTIGAIKPNASIEEVLEERPTAGPIAASHAALNGHSHPDPKAAETPTPIKKPDVIDSLEDESKSTGLIRHESAPVDPLKAQVKHQIDWEIPRKALHSSIGFVVLGLYAFSFTITPIVLVLFSLLVAISTLDFIRLNNPQFEAFYERAVGILMRESEKKKINGTVWYLIGVIFVLSVYPSDIAVVSILILSWADTAASTIGRLWGRYTPPLPRRIPYIGLRFAPRKSTAGYGAAFVTGAVISAAFMSYHSSRTPYTAPAPLYSLPTLGEFKHMNWNQLSTLLRSMTNFDQLSVSHTPPSWNWEQRVGGGWPGLLVLGLWSGLITAIAEAMDLGDMDDNLTLPVLSGLGIWAYIGLLRWIDQRMLSAQ